MKIDFIGLGNVGGKLAGSLLRNGFDLIVRDLDRALAAPFIEAGAGFAETPKAMAQAADIVITCLPSPAASAAVMEAKDGVIAGLTAGKIWLEMSTTDEAEVRRLGALVAAAGAVAMDSPVSGGCASPIVSTSSRASRKARNSQLCHGMSRPIGRTGKPPPARNGRHLWVHHLDDLK